MQAATKSSRLPAALSSGAWLLAGATGSGTAGAFTERQIRPPRLPTRTFKVWLSMITGGGNFSSAPLAPAEAPAPAAPPEAPAPAPPEAPAPAPPEAPARHRSRRPKQQLPRRPWDHSRF